MFADWTDRIAAGELPPAPTRPQGLERNVVITQWDWADPTAYLHDLVSTDRRNPTVNAYGKIYGALEESADYLPVLDPVNHTLDQIPLTMMDPEATPRPPVLPWRHPPTGATKSIWDRKNNVHNPMMDSDGRVWITSRGARSGTTPPSARKARIIRPRSCFRCRVRSPSGRVRSAPAGNYTHINTCFGTHHLMFAEDANNTLWTSGGGQVVGWLNTEDVRGDRRRAAARRAGRRSSSTPTATAGATRTWSPNDAVDPTKDKRIDAGFYAVAPAPDGSVWGSMLGFPGRRGPRSCPATEPQRTRLAEVYEPPFDNPNGARSRASRRAAWTSTATASSGWRWPADTWRSFDRRKCKGPLNGPTATGQHCPEGWTLLPRAAAAVQGRDRSGSAEGSYYTWVDQFDTLGLGENVPINTGNPSDGLLVLKDGRVGGTARALPAGLLHQVDGRPHRRSQRRLEGPRPVGHHQHSHAVPHGDGAGTTSKVIQFQMRPDPLSN